MKNMHDSIEGSAMTGRVEGMRSRDRMPRIHAKNVLTTIRRWSNERDAARLLRTSALGITEIVWIEIIIW